MVGGGGDADEPGERVPSLGDDGVRAAGEVGGGRGEEPGGGVPGDAARRMEAWVSASALLWTTAAALREAMAASETVSIGEATQGTDSGTRRERRVERSTASAGKSMYPGRKIMSS